MDKCCTVSYGMDGRKRRVVSSLARAARFFLLAAICTNLCL
jgi:hypothetical protein